MAGGLTRYPKGEDSGFEKSEPRVFEHLSGKKPVAQSAWRIDFREDGYRAFLRPYADDERELQLNLFCEESIKGRLFASIEIHGPAKTIADAIEKLTVKTDIFSWQDARPVVWQQDRLVSEVITEVPSEHIVDLLAKAGTYEIDIALKSPYKPIEAESSLVASRKVLLFAANNCASGHYPGPRAPLQ